MTLPENSVITYGNDEYTYREYVERYMKSAPRREMPELANNRKVSPHFFKDRITDRSFKVPITFPELDRTQPAQTTTVGDDVLIRLDIDPADRDILANQQFEVMLFVDTEFFAEEERGYLPFTYRIELDQLPPGEHVITANVITFGDQIGIGSRRIRIER